MKVWLAQHGVTRDSAIWLWGKILAAATLIVSATADPHLALIDLSALGISPHMVHLAQVLSMTVLYLAGQLSTSSLLGNHDAALLTKPSPVGR